MFRRKRKGEARSLAARRTPSRPMVCAINPLPFGDAPSHRRVARLWLVSGDRLRTLETMVCLPSLSGNPDNSAVFHPRAAARTTNYGWGAGKLVSGSAKHRAHARVRRARNRAARPREVDVVRAVGGVAEDVHRRRVHA